MQRRASIIASTSIERGGILMANVEHSLRVRRAVIAVLASVAGVVAATAPAGAVGTPGTWTTISSVPNGGPSLYAIDAISANDVWAVGQGSDYLTHAQHWDGTTWTKTPTPSVAGAFLSALRGVAAVSSNDVWAVGDNSGGTPLIVHWNGASWATSPLPPLTGYSALNGVSVVSANDVWAVGSTTSTRTLVLRWNGSTWNVVPSPNPSTTKLPYNFLYGVHVTAANDVWAVGTYSRKGKSPQTLTLRWNGTSWRHVATPALTGPSGLDVYSRFLGVTATSASDAWAVGTVGNQPLAMHFNGSAWSVVPTPNAPYEQGFLYDVDAVAANDVWAVGVSQRVFAFIEPQTTYSASLIEHFDGTAWSIVPSPNPVVNATDVRSVSALSSTSVWASGALGFTARYTA